MSSSPVAHEPYLPDSTPLSWTEHDLDEMNITIVDMPSSEMAAQVCLTSDLALRATHDGDTADIANADGSPWYNDFCFLLIQWLMEEGLETTNGNPAHVAWTTEALELRGPSGTTTVQADLIFSLAGITSLAYATPRCLPEHDQPAHELGYYVAILIAMAQHVAAEVGEQTSYSARLLCPCKDVGKFVFLTADVSHVFIENLENGPPQVEMLCVYREVFQEGAQVEEGACDIVGGVHEVAEVKHEEELYEPPEGVHVGEKVYVDEEDYVDAEEEIHLEQEVQDVSDNPISPAADSAAL